MKCTNSYAHPFDNEVIIRYHLPRVSKVALRIYGNNQRIVFQIFAHSQKAGEQIFRWNGKDHLGSHCPDGQYYYLIDVDGVYEISGEINWSASMNHQNDARIAV